MYTEVYVLLLIFHTFSPIAGLGFLLFRSLKTQGIIHEAGNPFLWK